MFRQLTYADFTVQALEETYKEYGMAAVCYGDERGISWTREDEE